MIELGKWSGLIPARAKADVLENVRWRKRVRERADGNVEYRNGLVRACGEDLLFYVNFAVWQYNPRKRGEELKVGPFVTWDFQDEAFKEILWCIENDEDLVIEKSREMGASWMCLILMEWLWHFHPWQKFLMISRNEKAVEDEDPDSLFWKIDFIHRYLPGWLKPKCKRRKLYFGNEGNGSTITGQATTGKAGVGGRATAMFIDEFSQIDEDYEVLHRTSDTTGCRVFNFTHKGTGTAAFELTRRVDMRKLRLHWTQHPEKKKGLYEYESKSGKVLVHDKEYAYPIGFNFVMDGSPMGGPRPGLRSPWYDAQCRRKGSDRAIAMDLDIDPQGSVDQMFDRLMVRQLQEACCMAPFWEGDLCFDADYGKPIELQARVGGLLKLWLQLKADGRPPVGKYAIGVDSSEGVGATSSCLSVVALKTGEKVAEYQNALIRPESLAVMVVAICWVFKDAEGEGARLIWEKQGPGLIFGRKVLELGYRNLYYQKSELGLHETPSSSPGWYPSPDNKDMLLKTYQSSLKMGLMLNRSRESLEDCLNFRYNDSGHIEHGGLLATCRPSGAKINHGDQVIADALACKMIREVDRVVHREEIVRISPLSLAWRRQNADNERREAEAWA